MARKPSRADKHQRIIRAAVKVFAQKGFYQAKVSEIARAAGVADGTIYLYFQNKDDILISLFEQEMAGILSSMKQALEQTPDPAGKLAAFAHTHLRLMESNQELAEIIQVEIRQSFKFMKEYQNLPFMEYLNLVGGVIEEGQKDGTFRSDIQPGVFKRAFFGALDEMSRYWVLSTSRKYDIDTAANQIIGFFIKGILQ
jgi:TetR/AcrR family fatty acid metabolism transcriptional regulator